MSFTNPAPGGTRTRTDQGVDWANITGAIRAVAAGKIVQVYYGLQGFGTTIIEKVRGSNEEIYYGLETGGTSPIGSGRTVKRGQPVAQGTGPGGGIEVGIWNPATGRPQGAPDFTGANATPAGRSFLSQLSGGRGVPRATSSATNVPSYVPKQYRSWVTEAAQQTGLPASVVAAQIQDESTFRANAYNKSSHASGIAQFLPSTWKIYGKGSPFNPDDAQAAYIKYMKALLIQYNGNIRDALAAYGGGIPAGYTYADNILSAAHVKSSARAGRPSTFGGTRPGGQPAGQSSVGATDDIFGAYEAELNTPRTAPPGTRNPLAWWWMSFSDSWEKERNG